MTASEQLRWKRRVSWGPGGIEIRGRDTLLGELVPLNGWGTRYRGEIGHESWMFTRRFRPTTLTAYDERSGSPVARAYPAGFRRRRVELASGTTLELQQRDWHGRRYELGWIDGPLLITARNTDGPLRWRGEVNVKSSAVELGDATRFLVVFVLFLMLHSSELHFG